MSVVATALEHNRLLDSPKRHNPIWQFGLCGREPHGTGAISVRGWDRPYHSYPILSDLILYPILSDIPPPQLDSAIREGEMGKTGIWNQVVEGKVKESKVNIGIY
jgi:hypothetical protein